MSVRRVCGAFFLGLVLMAAVPASTEAAHRHHRVCNHGRVYSYDYRPYYGGHYYSDRYYSDRYYDDRYYGRYRDDVDYDAPYVARHGSGRYSYDDYGYDYRYRGSSRYSYGPRYGSRRVGYHYHGRTRCYRPDRPHIHFTLRLF